MPAPGKSSHKPEASIKTLMANKVINIGQQTDGKFYLHSEGQIQYMTHFFKSNKNCALLYYELTNQLYKNR